MPQTLDAAAVRTWCSLALEALGRDREEIDAINVYPVADGDTGTNLYLTVESAVQRGRGGLRRTRDRIAPCPPRPTPYAPWRTARSSGPGATPGTILAQLLRGMAEVLRRDDR